MTENPKRYIKIEHDGETFILDTHTELTIGIEDVCSWLNYEWKERQYEANRCQELHEYYREEMRELRRQRDSLLLRGVSRPMTTRPYVDLRQRRRRAAA